MTVSLPWDRLLQDMLDCMGWGLLLAIGYDLARTLVGTGFWRCLVLDLTGFLAAAVVVRGYGAGISAAGVPRWYHVLGMILGASAWFGGVAPALAEVRRKVLWLAGRPVRLARIWVFAPFKERVKALKKEKKKKSRELPRKQLPKKGRMLYNSK